ncbi:hypothetical protein M3Y96_00479400 [Aphelenchoides besseyi]|nr:hypothetical protein M3Y96_00479400 [Aphelenchoides besseyi]
MISSFAISCFLFEYLGKVAVKADSDEENRNTPTSQIVKLVFGGLAGIVVLGLIIGSVPFAIYQYVKTMHLEKLTKVEQELLEKERKIVIELEARLKLELKEMRWEKEHFEENLKNKQNTTKLITRKQLSTVTKQQKSPSVNDKYDSELPTFVSIPEDEEAFYEEVDQTSYTCSSYETLFHLSQPAETKSPKGTLKVQAKTKKKKPKPKKKKPESDKTELFTKFEIISTPGVPIKD